MIKKYPNNIIGLTLVEIMIGIIITSLMMAAMYTSYTVVNQSYTQVSEKAKISRSSRDLVSMLMRDVRMAGFKYYAGTDQIAKFAEDTTAACGAPGIVLPKLSYLYFENGFDDSTLSHNPIVIRKNTQGAGETTSGNPEKFVVIKFKLFTKILIKTILMKTNNPLKDIELHILHNKQTQQLKLMEFLNVLKVIVSQELDVFSDPAEPSTTKGTWINTCTECTPEDVLVRDHIEDMEFIPIDENGKNYKR